MRLAPLLLLLLSATAPCPAAAQGDPTEARRHFDAGVQHFQDGRFREALDEFRDAYRIRPHPSVLVNVANCYMELRRPVDAAMMFERYLREAGDIDTERRAELERALGQARAAIATIDVQGPPGTVVFVDGDSIGRVPLRRPVEVNPGPHVIDLRHPNGSVRQERVELATGQAVTVDVTSAETPPPGPAPTTPTPRDPQPPDGSGNDPPAAFGPGDAPPEPEDDGGGLSVPIGTWVAGGVAVVALGLGIAFGATALSQQSEFDDIVRDIRSRPPGDPMIPELQAEGQAVADAQSSNALAADLMFVTAAVGAGVAVFFLITAPDDDNGGVAAAIAPARGGATLVLAGRL
jgi:hypothetical protein